jgi:hypothetical protein
MAQFDTGVAVPGGGSFAVPQLNFQPLADISKNYYAGQQAQDELATRRAFRNGIPTDPNTGYPDYTSMANTLARTGAPLSTIMPLVTSGAQLRAGQQSATDIGGGGGYTGGNTTQPPAYGPGPAYGGPPPATGGTADTHTTGGTGGPPESGSGPNGDGVPTGSKTSDTTAPGTPSTAPQGDTSQQSTGKTYLGMLDHVENRDQNPMSSAVGFGQFTDRTYRDIRAAYPQLELPQDRRQATVDQMKAATLALTASNSELLFKANVPINAPNEYLAHLLGAQGAINMYSALRRNPNAPAYQYATPGAVNANQTLFFKNGRPVTVSQFYGNQTGPFRGIEPFVTPGQRVKFGMDRPPAPPAQPPAQAGPAAAPASAAQAQGFPAPPPAGSPPGTPWPPPPPTGAPFVPGSVATRSLAGSPLSVADRTSALAPQTAVDALNRPWGRADTIVRGQPIGAPPAAAPPPPAVPPTGIPQGSQQASAMPPSGVAVPPTSAFAPAPTAGAPPMAPPSAVPRPMAAPAAAAPAPIPSFTPPPAGPTAIPPGLAAPPPPPLTGPSGPWPAPVPPSGPPPAGAGRPVPRETSGQAVSETTGQAGYGQRQQPQNYAELYPSATALMPPQWAGRVNPAQYATYLRQQLARNAPFLTPQQVQNSENQIKAVQDAIVKDTTPPEQYRQYQLSKNPGETYDQWMYRTESAKNYAKPPSAVQEAQAGQGQYTPIPYGASGAPAAGRPAAPGAAAAPGQPAAGMPPGAVNVPGYQAEVERQKEAAKSDVKAADTTSTEAEALGNAAYNSLDKVQWLKGMMSQPGVYTGPLQEESEIINQFKSVFGGPPTSALPQEAFGKVVNDMLSEQIKAMGKSGVGRVLMAEVVNMRNSIASKGMTPASNRALLELTMRAYQQAIDLKQVIADAPHTRAGQQAAIDQYRQTHSLITQEEKARPMLLGSVDAPQTPDGKPLSAQALLNWSRQMGVQKGDPVRINGKYMWMP